MKIIYWIGKPKFMKRFRKWYSICTGKWYWGFILYMREIGASGYVDTDLSKEDIDWAKKMISSRMQDPMRGDNEPKS